MAFVNELAKLFPGEIVTLIEIDGTKFGALTYHFHNENIAFTNAEILANIQNNTPLAPKVITWQGNTYGGRPFGIGQIETTSSGTPARPQLAISNIDGRISAMCNQYDGMAQAKVTIWIIPKASLDNSSNDAQKLIYYIDRPSSLNRTQVTFDLTNPFDMDGLQIPARNIQPNCFWAQRGWYRSGKGCSYNGNRYFDIDNNPVTDPSKDVCSGTVTGCKLRFQDAGLDFGGCISVSMIKR